MRKNDLPGTVDDKQPSTGPNALQSTTAPQSEATAAQTTGLDLRGYELMERLGGGGMGDVYRAGDPALGRDLAVKVMKVQMQGYVAAEQRFLREARVTGSLQHPGIVPIHNLGRLSDGRLHYTMRLVRGRTLSEILKAEAGKPEHLPALLTIFEKICQAVAYAHSKQVIHRDLKPANVMVGRFGEVQVMDWGLAKLLNAEDEPERTGESTGTRIYTEAGDTPIEQTRMGREMGTPAYMPPEQALGEWDTVDERADVFALGAILCEILTGKPPYTGDESGDALRKAKRGDLSEALGRLESCSADAALEQLCRDCLASNREGRPRDAEQVAQRVGAYQAEVQERLRRAELERTAAEIKMREERKRRRVLFGSMLLLSLAAVVSSWLAVRANNAAEAERGAKQTAEKAVDAERLAREAESEQRRLAEEQKQRAEENAHKAEASEADTKAVLKYFQDKVLAAGRPKDQEGGLGKDVTLRQAVDKAAKDIADSFKDRPLVEASIRETLGTTYWYLGEAALAIEQHEQALALREAKLGRDHPDTLDSRNNLATAYLSAGRTADAIRLHEQNLKQQEAKLGTDHPNTLLSMANLGSAYRDAGQLKDAIAQYEATLRRARQRTDGLPASLAWVPRELAQVYERDGQFAKAEPFYRDALEQAQKQFGSDDPRAAVALAQLGANLLRQKKYTDAEPLLRQFLTILEKKQPDDWSTFNTRSALGEALLGQKKYAEAEPLLVQGYEGMKQRQDKIPSSHRQLRLNEALERLVRLYEATEQKEKAVHWRKELQAAKVQPKATKP